MGVRKRRMRGSSLCPHRAWGRRTPARTWSAVGDELRQGWLGTSRDVGAPAREITNAGHPRSLSNKTLIRDPVAALARRRPPTLVA